MKSMKLTPAEAKEEVSYDSPPKAPEYPYGLSICLDDETLKKLDMESIPDIGAVLTLEAKVIVCSKSQYENQGGADTSMSLQITDMDLSLVDADKRTAGQKIYGKK